MHLYAFTKVGGLPVVESERGFASGTSIKYGTVGSMFLWMQTLLGYADICWLLGVSCFVTDLI
jgi:hypothetical protein